jgi:DNA-binding transcriptional MerR regulator
MATNGGESLTIDQLAQRTGMTVRNIRAHQSRGLLDPPAVKGRTGYYGGDHIARIELIRQLQADGYSLDLIGRMLTRTAGRSADALRFTRALREPWTDEEARIIDSDELARRYGTDEGVLAKAEELGLIRPVGGGRWEEISPRLGRAGIELTSLGVSPEKAVKVVARVRKNADSASRTFVRLFLEEVWQPFLGEGSPDERWPEVSDALERMRPLASDSMLAIFQMAMDEEVEQAFGRELARARRHAKRRR